MYVTRINLKNVDKEKIVEICEGIEKVDQTFKWKIVENYLEVESVDKNQSVKRGLLLCKKYFKELGDFGFDVRW